MSKKNTTTPPQLFVVETLHTFRMRYLVESETAKGAELVVVRDGFSEEWQQKFMGDTILTVQPLSREEATEAHTASEDSSWDGSPWMPLDSMIMRSKDGV